jgi:hypothetical protein
MFIPLSFPGRPDLGPSHRYWDVFGEDGHLNRTVSLTAAFDPRVVTADQVYGFLELSTGEVVIAVCRAGCAT